MWPKEAARKRTTNRSSRNQTLLFSPHFPFLFQFVELSYSFPSRMLSLGNPFVPGISAPASVSSLYAVAFKRRWKRCSASFEHRESIDIIGEVKCWVRDLEEAWEKENDRQRTDVTRDKAASVVEFAIAAPRPTVWEHFTLPGLRPKWRGADEVRETLESGRRGVGTTNYCMHGPHAIIARTHGRGSSIFVVNSIFHIPPIFNHPSGHR
jgi:hypothetical protein